MITITTPTLDALSVENSSRVSFTGSVKNFHISLKNGSSATLSGNTTTLDIAMENASRLEAKDFVATTSTVDLTNGSRASVNISNTLSGKLTNASTLTQYGTASTEHVNVTNGSRIDQRD